MVRAASGKMNRTVHLQIEMHKESTTGLSASTAVGESVSTLDLERRAPQCPILKRGAVQLPTAKRAPAIDNAVEERMHHASQIYTGHERPDFAVNSLIPEITTHA